MRIVITAMFVAPGDWHRPSADEIESALRQITPAYLRTALTPTMPAAASVPDAEWGGWVGPHARVTRIWSDQTLGVIGGTVITRVAALYEFPDAGWPARSMDYPWVIAALAKGFLTPLVQYSSVTGTTVITAVAGGVIGYGPLTALWGSIGAIATTWWLVNYVGSAQATGQLVVGEHPVPYAEAFNGPLALWTSGQIANTRTRDAPNTFIASSSSDEVADGPTSAGRQPVGALETIAGGIQRLGQAAAGPATDFLKWTAIAVGTLAASYVAYRIASSWTTRRTYETTRRTRDTGP